MALRYYEALKALNEPTPKDSYKADYDAIVDMTFDNAYNIAYNEIEYEKWQIEILNECFIRRK